jgi:hypothetical protein
LFTIYEREGNWRSLNPDTAMRGVRDDMNRSELIEVAYNARCGAARRIALVRLNDPAVSATFAREDPDPLVRRRLARMLDDLYVLECIVDMDIDASVREAAQQRLDALKETPE